MSITKNEPSRKTNLMQTQQVKTVETKNPIEQQQRELSSLHERTMTLTSKREQETRHTNDERTEKNEEMVSYSDNDTIRSSDESTQSNSTITTTMTRTQEKERMETEQPTATDSKNKQTNDDDDDDDSTRRSNEPSSTKEPASSSSSSASDSLPVEIEQELARMKDRRKFNQGFAAYVGGVVGLIALGPLGAAAGGILAHQVTKQTGRAKERRIRRRYDPKQVHRVDRTTSRRQLSFRLLPVHQGVSV